MTDIDLDSLPWSRESEQVLLGCLLSDPAAMEHVAGVERRMFFDPLHGRIFEAISGLANAGRAFDIVAVFEKLQLEDREDEEPLLPYLNALAQGVLSTRQAKSAAEVVRDKAAHRALIETMQDALELARGRQAYTEKLHAISALLEKLHRQAVRSEPRRLDALVRDRIDHVTQLAAGEKAAAWSTHIPRLNAALNGGLQPGRVVVLAARPSIGKSSLAQDLGQCLARVQGLPTLLLSQEMPEGEVADRAMTNIGRIDYSRIQTGRLGDEDWGRLTEASDGVAGVPFYVDDQPGLTLGDIQSKARLVPGLKVLIIDYIQLCTGSGDTRNDEIEEISRGLKRLAKTMGVCVIVLSQLNRAVEKRADKRPNLADLRDSGAIEQDADIVIFLWRDADFEVNGILVIGCGIDKNRQGKITEFALGFNGAQQRWLEADRELSGAAAKRPWQQQHFNG